MSDRIEAHLPAWFELPFSEMAKALAMHFDFGPVMALDFARQSGLRLGV